MIPNSKNKVISPNFKHVYQIYYDNDSRKQCYFNQWENVTLSPFFENEVIKEILLSEKFTHIGDSEWVAILSPKFFSKARGYAGFVTPTLLNEFLENTHCDAVGFQAKSIQSRPLHFANNKHPYFLEIIEMLLAKSGIDYDIRQKSRVVAKKHGYAIRGNIYSNYIFAKKYVWEKYRDEMFLPMYEAMETAEGRLKELLWMDSGYSKKNKIKNRLNDQLGVCYYPYHTFICERFWTMFLNLHPEIPLTHYGL